MVTVESIAYGPEPALDEDYEAAVPARAAWRAARTITTSRFYDDLNVPGDVTAVGDVLADLMHLVDALGVDWDDVVNRADMHHQMERAEAAR